MKQLTRGNALGGTLLVMVLLFIFGLTLANMATFDLRLVNRTGERLAAREAAEAGIHHVMTLICQDPTEGTNNNVYEQTFGDGSGYRVTFDNDDPDFSVNNLASLGTNPAGRSRLVPPNHCLIFAEGRSKAGEIAIVESLFRLEALPYAVAGTNKLRTGLAAQILADPAGGAGSKANTYSGSLASDSTRLGLGTNVDGDVHSAGGAVVAGASYDSLETNHDPVQLPNLNITDFDTSGISGVDTRGGGLLNGLVLSGPVYIDDDANFALVTLNNATVYVDGDLTVSAALLGTGAIFVNGTTTFTAAVHMSPSARITLFSQGDISVLLASTFRGVLYTHGDFNSGLVALLVHGAIYAQGATPSKGNITINGLASIITHDEAQTSFASFWLAMGGEAEPVLVYWNQLR